MSIQEHLNKIRNAIYGREVRESIAKGIETAYDDASEKDNANMEVKLARGTNPNLNTRLNKMDATDSQNTKKIDSNHQEVTAQLAQTNSKKVDKDGSQQVKWANIAQDAREQISGDKVAVVGKDSVGTENLTSEAVTYDKTNFADEVSFRIKNKIYNGNFSKDSDGDGWADGFVRGGLDFELPRVENNTQYWTPLSTSTSGSLRTATDNQPSFLANHKYYISAEFKNIRRIRHDGNNITGGIPDDGHFSTTHSYEHDVSGNMFFDTREENIEASVSNLVIVDLTDVFGFGKEPDIDYFEFLLRQRGVHGWFDEVNLTDMSKNPLLTAKELKVYDTQNNLPSQNVNDVLLHFADYQLGAQKELHDLESSVLRIRGGKNKFNPNDTVPGRLKVQIGSPLEILEEDYYTSRIALESISDISMKGPRIYTFTDEDDFCIYRDAYIEPLEETNISSSEIPEEAKYLWVTIRPEDVERTQIEFNSSLSPYEPYIEIEGFYVGDKKVADYPLGTSGESDKKKELHELSINQLQKDDLMETNSFLTANGMKSLNATPKDERDIVKIDLKNTNEKKIILHLHNRENDGFDVVNDAYLPNAEKDFSDVNIKSDTGEILPYRTTYHTENFDIIADSRLGVNHAQSQVFKNSHSDWLTTHTRYIRISKDEGKTWADLVYSSEFRDGRITLVSKDDTLYFNHEGVVYRSEYPYETYVETFDLSINYPNSLVQTTGMVQHEDGDIFFGTYQNARHIMVYKSTDNGETWEKVLDVPEKYQHVHAMYIDNHQTPSAIYVGVDGGGGVYKTTDKGQSWVDLRENSQNMPQSTDFGVTYSDASGYRLLGGETSVQGGYSIIKTMDDVEFYPVLDVGTGVLKVHKLNGVLFGAGSGTRGSRYGAIYVSEDEGESWEEAYATSPLNLSSGVNDGFRYLSHMGNQLVAGHQSSQAAPLRIFPEGSYAEIIVDVPEGANHVVVESGHSYSNEMPVHNDTEMTGDFLVNFDLNTGGSVIQEKVSGEYFKDDFEWANIGKHLSHFYPYIILPSESKSVLIETLSGYTVDTTSFDVTEGVTISLWGRLGYDSDMNIFETDLGDTLAYTAHRVNFNGNTKTSIQRPLVPRAVNKLDLVITHDGTTQSYVNGQMIYEGPNDSSDILTAINNSSEMKFLNSFSNDGESAIQHFSIRKGVVDAQQLHDEFNSLITDNYN